MTVEYDPSLPAINETKVEHHCFGCGSANPQGLGLRFRPLENGAVWADFTPQQVHEGYLGMTHGGILATIADEAMSWAVTNNGEIGVTARMSLTFRRPAKVGEPLRVTGEVTGARSRVIETSARVTSLATGDVVAEAEGRFVRVSREQAGAWKDAYEADSEASAFGTAISRRAGQ